MIRTALSPAERKTMLPSVTATGWSQDTTRDALTKRFIFKDFLTALDFMNAVGAVAEELNHHPEWFNVYSRVDVTLTTHDAEGLTELDLTLAARMDALAAERGVKTG